MPAPDLSPHLIQIAQLYAPGRGASDAVAHLVEDYPRLVSEVRELRRRVAQFDQEQHDFDFRLQELQTACRSILDL